MRRVRKNPLRHGLPYSFLKFALPIGSSLYHQACGNMSGISCYFSAPPLHIVPNLRKITCNEMVRITIQVASPKKFDEGIKDCKFIAYPMPCSQGYCILGISRSEARVGLQIRIACFEEVSKG